MNLTINGEARKVQAGDLAALLQELAMHDRVVATALNGEFVPKGRRAQQALRDGDTVEIVSPMQGG